MYHAYCVRQVISLVAGVPTDTQKELLQVCVYQDTMLSSVILGLVGSTAHSTVVAVRGAAIVHKSAVSLATERCAAHCRRNISST
jgi:hypothetical protein